MFYYLRAWSTSPLYLIVGGGIVCGGVEFLPIFKIGRSKEGKIVEPWKEMGVGGWGPSWWPNSFFFSEYNSKNFCLSYLCLFCVKFLEFLFIVCVYDVPWASICVHIIAKKGFLLYFVLAISS